MMKYFLALVSLFSILIFSPISQINAGGGNVRLEPSAMRSSIGRPITVRAYLTDESALNSPQNIQIKIRNQWPSANCTMDTTVVNAQGYVSAVCSTTTDGLMEIYGVWIEKGDESQSMFLEFQKEQHSTDPAQPLVATPVVKSKPSPTPVVTPTPAPTATAAAETPLVIQDLENQIDDSNQVDRRIGAAVSVLIIGLLMVLMAGGRFAQHRRLTKSIAGIASIGLVLMAMGAVYASSLALNQKETQNAQSNSTATVSSSSPMVEVAEPSPAVTPTPVPPPITDVKVTLSGEVIHDQNCDYLKNPGEPGLANIEIPISSFGTATDRTLGYVTTNEQGRFSYTTTIKSNQQLSVQARVEMWGYGMNNFPEMPGAVTLTAKRPNIHQLFPLMKVDGGCDQIAR